MADKISQMLTKIRNAQMAGHQETMVGFSKLKFALAKILERESFIESVAVDKNIPANIKIRLKYYQISNNKKTAAINGLKRISRPGQRIYVKSKDIKKVKNKFGIAVISTSKGIMTDKESKNLGLGGEYICEVW